MEEGDEHHSEMFRFDRGYWSDVQRASDDLAQELNLTGRGRYDTRLPRNDQDGRSSSGRLRWRWTVDGESQLVVRRSNVESHAVSGRGARKCLSWFAKISFIILSGGATHGAHNIFSGHWEGR